jgi:hypothetical protein
MQERKTDRGATHVPADEGRSYWLGTELHTFKAVGEDTGWTFALEELRAHTQRSWTAAVRSRRVPDLSSTCLKAASTCTGTRETRRPWWLLAPAGVPAPPE